MSESQGSARLRLERSVIVGEDNFLFHRDHEAVEQVTGSLPLSGADVKTWKDILEARAAWCESRHVTLRILFVPEKHVVYSDKIPELRISDARPVLQILSALAPGTRAKCLYPVEALRAHRHQFETYFQTDTHWTQEGAFVAHDELVRSLREEIDISPVVEKDLVRTQRTYIGDLGVRLEPEREETTVFLSHGTFLPFRRVFENKGFSRGSTIAFESPRLEAPSLVVFRDSFFNTILPHMVPVFSRVVVVSSIDMHYDLVDSENPDVIVFEIAERFVGFLDQNGRRCLPTDSPVRSFEEFSGVDVGVLKASGGGKKK